MNGNVRSVPLLFPTTRKRSTARSVFYIEYNFTNAPIYNRHVASQPYTTTSKQSEILLYTLTVPTPTITTSLQND